MNKFKIIYLIFFNFAFPYFVMSQNLPVVLFSNNKVTIDGKKYYIHIVKKGETLSAISRTYKVPIDSIRKDNLDLTSALKINQYVKVRIIDEKNKNDKYFYHNVKKGDTPTNIAKRYEIKIDDIYNLNPESELSIKIGQTLKIPIKSDNVKIKKDTLKVAKVKLDTAKNYFIYKVAKKETKYGLSRKFNISVQVIDNINNLQNKQLQVGDFIKIPVNNNLSYYHKVEPKETVYSLSKKYGLSKRQFYKLNPIVKERGLQVGESIVIPKNNKTNEIFANKKNEQKEEYEYIVVDKKENYKQKNIKYEKIKQQEVDKKTKYKVAFFLPVYLNENDTLGNYENELVIKNNLKKSSKLRLYNKSRMFLEFYEGALLALQDLKKQGMSFEVSVFDTENDTTHIKQVLKENNLSDYDLFIGPFYGAILNIVNDYAWDNRINIVSPLSLKKSFIEYNPYAFQVSPPFEIQMLYASEYLNDFDTKNYIVIHDGKNINQEYISAFKKELYSQIDETNYMQVKYNEIFYYQAKESDLEKSFSKNIKNILIVPSNNRAFVSDIMGKLNGFSYNYDIITFGQPWWMSFDNIELEYFHNTNTRFFSNSFIDYSQPEAKDFVLRYRKFYNSEPQKYAFKGYDITKYFCSALNYYGNNFRKYIHVHTTKLLQTNFNFVRYSDQGGYQNTGIYILEYSNDNKLIKSKEYPSK